MARHGLIKQPRGGEWGEWEEGNWLSTWTLVQMNIWDINAIISQGWDIQMAR